MKIGAALRAHLISDSVWKGEQIGVQIAALVVRRIYPLRLPQKAVLPAIVLTRISAIRWSHLRGPGGLARPRYQLDAWAPTYDGAMTLGSLCRQRLDGFAGTWTDEESPETAVRISVFFDSEQDLFEEEVMGGLCRHSADYLLFHGTAGGTV